MLRVVTQIDRFGVFLRFHAAPRFAPQPLLRKRVDGDLVLNEVRQVLVEVGE